MTPIKVQLGFGEAKIISWLRFDLDNENGTIRNYRDRVRQCEALGEFATAEQIREILVNEQDHQIGLATARRAKSFLTLPVPSRNSRCAPERESRPSAPTILEGPNY